MTPRLMTRIVTFPVRGRRWAFHAMPVAVERSSCSSSATSSEERLSLRDVLRKLREARQMSERATIVEKFARNSMLSQWKALEVSPPGSLKHRVYSAGDRLLKRIPPTENFLSSVSPETSGVEVIYPASLPENLVRRRVRHLAVSGKQSHTRRMQVAIALLPFSAALSILPLPNVFLFWNLFRAYAHWRALNGSRVLSPLLTSQSSSSSSMSFSKLASVDEAGRGESSRLSNSDRGDRAGRGSGGLGERRIAVNTDEEEGSDAKDRGESEGGKRGGWNKPTAGSKLTMVASSELDELLGWKDQQSDSWRRRNLDDGSPVSDEVLGRICRTYHIDIETVLKWRDYNF
ncbi:hypothetical protein CBR_g34164 [Chara braunii]|uniref:Uncharacterized protein n=1 Tax=Chara braunii TaxID=69332 RepID=A0A388LI30_CHABU|nr:hypothetical protein CBR_g34164 [Chara braunii]|eukprot:GBG81984.1 hypothetical protein CBR_g34164 [Chara braunii]